MKHLRTTTGLMLAGLLALTACGKEKAPNKAPKGETEIKLLCHGKEYQTDKKNFRASAIGESLDQATAKKKARANALNELASSISTTMKGVTDNYVNSREFNNREEVEERFESLSREVIDQKLSGIVTNCERHVTTPEGKWKTYINLELSADELVMALNERLSKDERLKIDYDYEKFKETFDKEMEKMESR